MVDNRPIADNNSLAHRPANPISIAMLFYVVTLAAILAACFRTVFSEKLATGNAVAAFLIAGGIVGFSVGSLEGFRRGGTSAWSGPLIGLALGILWGPLAMIQSIHFASVIGLAFTGCGIMVVVMLVAARYFQTPS